LSIPSGERTTFPSARFWLLARTSTSLKAKNAGYLSKAFQSFVTTLRNWHDYILNYFHERWSNGFAEGMNNKIKLLKRRGFGYTNFDHFRLRKGKKTPTKRLDACFHTALYGHRPVCQVDLHVMPQRGTGCSLISGLVMQAEACGP
jgi:hypothetical protein